MLLTLYIATILVWISLLVGMIVTGNDLSRICQLTILVYIIITSIIEAIKIAKGGK